MDVEKHYRVCCAAVMDHNRSPIQIDHYRCTVILYSVLVVTQTGQVTVLYYKFDVNCCEIIIMVMKRIEMMVNDMQV